MEIKTTINRTEAPMDKSEKTTANNTLKKIKNAINITFLAVLLLRKYVSPYNQV